MWFPRHSTEPYLPPINTRGTTQQHSWGIFNLVHQPGYSRPKPSISSKSTFLKSWPSILRFGRDLLTIAPYSFPCYIVGIVWTGVSPAISLYLCHAILDIMQRAATNGDLDPAKLSHLKILVIVWLTVAGTSNIIERFVNETSLVLDGHLRAYFMPPLAKASLHHGRDPSTDYKLECVLPGPFGFSDSAPGSEILRDLAQRFRALINLLVQLSVLVYISCLKSGSEKNIFVAVFLTFFFVFYCAPTNGLGGAGYAFWTDNEAYHRLNGLYAMIFSPQYRQSLMRDGIGGHVAEEFKRTSDEMGPIKSDLFTLAGSIPIPWYWTVARTIVVDYSLALYAFLFSWSPSPSSIATVAFLQHATTLLKQSVDTMQRDTSSVTTWNMMNKIRGLYEVVDLGTSSETSTALQYPNDDSSADGMNLSFRDVDLHYERPNEPSAVAVDGISLDIQAGQLVVIVGDNGSGKSSLLKLITKTMSPTSGQVKIDDKDIKEYDIHSLRRSIAFLSREQKIYPVSLAENILMGSPNLTEREKGNGHLIDEAARLGGANDLLQRFGHERVVNAPGIVNVSMQGCGNGLVGDDAMAELHYHTVHRTEVTVSDAEKQRIIVSRTFMRLMNSDVRLLVVDDPVSSWDAAAERDLFNKFLALRKGRTVIMVSHRFGNISQHADIILCMEAGKLVERGTHNELMIRNGCYAGLYNAQIAGA